MFYDHFSARSLLAKLGRAVLLEVLGNEVMARIVLYVHAYGTNVWTYNNMIVQISCCCTPC